MKIILQLSSGKTIELTQEEYNEILNNKNYTYVYPWFSNYQYFPYAPYYSIASAEYKGEINNA